MTKRLFIFAGYDKDCIADETLLHYLNSLSELGDIIVVMDNNLPDTEITKIKSIKNILSVIATRHDEYDFGSYKRGFQFAQEKNLLNKYDWFYFANDSVYGPLFNIKNILEDLESRGKDLTGLTDYTALRTPVHVQSWFVGISRRIANEQFFADFLNSVQHENSKILVISKYEVRLSQLILRHGYEMSTFIDGQDGEICHCMYKKPILMIKNGVPFVKKNALDAVNGLHFLLPCTTDELVNKIHNHAVRNRLPMMGDITYKKIFKLMLFGAPLFAIYRQKPQNALWRSYKICLFDKIPVIKISTNKDEN
jgi:lipopolysaccharide biosynthesis protein